MTARAKPVPAAALSSAPKPGTAEECWKDEEKALKELMVAARSFRTIMRAVGALSKMPKEKMVGAAGHARSSLGEALIVERAAFDRWLSVARQPGLFDPPPVPASDSESKH
jgi:hypothetical protein